MRSWLCWLNIFGDLLGPFALGLRSKSSLAAEDLFLRKQIAFYQERKIKPRRTDNLTRLTLVWLSRWFDWRNALTVMTPKTFIGWHARASNFSGVAIREDRVSAATRLRFASRPIVATVTFGCCMCLWSWNISHAGLFTPT